MNAKEWAEIRKAAEDLVSLLRKSRVNETIVGAAEETLEMVKFEERNALAWEVESRIPYYGG